MMNLITVKVYYNDGLYENIDCEKAEYDIEKNELNIITGTFVQKLTNVKKFETRRFAS